ncbi:MAG: hypothetical protein QXN15_04285 [Candidatus Jordarchaeales archaeon]|nr:hypothetical protein [Candidatus Jordarchaeia archaeon]
MSKYLSPPSEADVELFERMLRNVGVEEFMDAARSAADTVSARLKEGDVNGAAEYVFDMVVQSVMVNRLEAPRKVIDLLKRRGEKLKGLLENPIFRVSDKLLESFEKGDVKLFADAMSSVEKEVLGKTSLDIRFSIVKDIHCAFYKYTQ